MDKPYEHNAGLPYEARVFYKATGPEKCPEQHHPDGTPKFEIITLGWNGPYDMACEGHCNSPYCVDDLNSKRAPWLNPTEWSSHVPEGAHVEPIWGGDTIAQFVEKIQAAKGTVFWPLLAEDKSFRYGDNLTDFIEKKLPYNDSYSLSGPIKRYANLHAPRGNIGKMTVDFFDSMQELTMAVNQLVVTSRQHITSLDLEARSQLGARPVYEVFHTKEVY
jgi:hypothetical protein